MTNKRIILVDGSEYEIVNEMSITDIDIWADLKLSSYAEFGEAASKFTKENLALVKLVYDDIEQEYVNMTMDSEKKFSITDKGNEIFVTFRIRKTTEDEKKAEQVQIAIAGFDDEKARGVKDLYPTTDKLIGSTLPAGGKIVHMGFLYKALEDVAVTADIDPENDTEKFQYIDEDHEGTFEDPIPYHKDMVLQGSKYYTQNDIIYKSLRTAEYALKAPLDSLLDIYVKKSIDGNDEPEFPEFPDMSMFPPIDPSMMVPTWSEGFMTDARMFVQHNGVYYQALTNTDSEPGTDDTYVIVDDIQQAFSEMNMSLPIIPDVPVIEDTVAGKVGYKENGKDIS